LPFSYILKVNLFFLFPFFYLCSFENILPVKSVDEHFVNGTLNRTFIFSEKIENR
jgi:hypothetical protein